MIKNSKVRNLQSFKIKEASIYKEFLKPFRLDAWDQLGVCSAAKSPALTRRKELIKRVLGSANLTILFHNFLPLSLIIC